MWGRSRALALMLHLANGYAETISSICPSISRGVFEVGPGRGLPNRSWVDRGPGRTGGLPEAAMRTPSGMEAGPRHFRRAGSCRSRGSCRLGTRGRPTKLLLSWRGIPPARTLLLRVSPQGFASEGIIATAGNPTVPDQATGFLSSWQSRRVSLGGPYREHQPKRSNDLFTPTDSPSDPSRAHAVRLPTGPNSRQGAMGSAFE